MMRPRCEHVERVAEHIERPHDGQKCERIRTQTQIDTRPTRERYGDEERDGNPARREQWIRPGTCVRVTEEKVRPAEHHAGYERLAYATRRELDLATCFG